MPGETCEPAICAATPKPAMGRAGPEKPLTAPRGSRRMSRRWGTVIKHPDGRVELDPDPWPA